MHRFGVPVIPVKWRTAILRVVPVYAVTGYPDSELMQSVIPCDPSVVLVKNADQGPVDRSVGMALGKRAEAVCT
jgi:hypothetical protein